MTQNNKTINKYDQNYEMNQTYRIHNDPNYEMNLNYRIGLDYNKQLYTEIVKKTINNQHINPSY